MPLNPLEKEKWKHLPTRRCPSCLMANPSACTKCLDCDVIYIGESLVDNVRQVLPEEMPWAPYIPRGNEPWDIDDEAVIPWEMHATIPIIFPQRETDDSRVQPEFELSRLEGMRNRLDFIDSKTWNQKVQKNYLYLPKVQALEWPGGVLQFIQ